MPKEQINTDRSSAQPLLPEENSHVDDHSDGRKKQPAQRPPATTCQGSMSAAASHDLTGSTSEKPVALKQSSRRAIEEKLLADRRAIAASLMDEALKAAAIGLAALVLLNPFMAMEAAASR
jgi:hypothetical protein